MHQQKFLIACQGGKHEVIVFHNYIAKYIPIIILKEHHSDELDKFIENPEYNGKYEECGCLRYAAEWKSARRYFIFPSPATNIGPIYKKYKVLFDAFDSIGLNV